MTVSGQLEAAHIREATITACQLRLREMGRGVAEGLVEGEPESIRQIAVKFGQHLHDAADALDTLREPTEIPSESRMRLQQAAELAYRLTTTATTGHERWGALVDDLWNVLRLYELPGKEGS
jgi:hypothetical protein